MLKIFVCSPFRGNQFCSEEQNINNAIKYSRFVISQGNMPLVPHLLYPRMLNDNIENERNLGIKFGLELINICDAVYVFGKTISEGMQHEIIYAQKIGKKILHVNLNLETKDNELF